MEGGSLMEYSVRAAEGGGGAAGSPAPPPQAGTPPPLSPPSNDLALALDRFIQDSAAFDSISQWKVPATTSAHTATTTLNGVPPLTSDEISRLFQFEGGEDGALGALLPNVFTGEDGDELLGIQFADLMSPKAADGEKHAPEQGGAEGDDDHLQDMADAARSMLAALEPDAPAGQVASTPLGSGGVGPPQAPQPVMMQHGGMVGYFSPGPDLQQQQQQQQQQAMAAMSMGYQVLPAGQYMYVDPATGQLIPATPAMPSMMALPGQPLMFGGQPMAMQLVMQQGGGMMAFHPGMHSIMHSMPMAESPTKKPKRKRAVKPAGPTEAPIDSQDRSARLAAGYSYDSLTGQAYRHGPALLAAAMQDRELPVVNSVFDAQAAAPFGSTPPPPGAHPGFEPQHNAASSGRDPSSRAGQHGFITGQVTKELQSNTPSAMPAMPSEPQAPDDGGERRLLGVARDKWSLFWDAYVQPNPGSQQAQQAQQAASGSPPPSSLLAGFRQEAVYLGKFPTQQQAGRAHDIAALKLHGTGAQTNFPVEQYTRTLPALQTHTEEQVLQALRKDAALALQRTSKYKGVRRVGPGQYEARTEPAEPPPPAGGTPSSPFALASA